MQIPTLGSPVLCARTIADDAAELGVTPATPCSSRRDPSSTSAATRRHASRLLKPAA
ncbi:hypothetical protein [Nonomuraea dietziae]|uniref:hypothetical protein n=1 Tax=Nonomuraea dietziae TaxID=65515 RepID=UPI0034223C51